EHRGEQQLPPLEPPNGGVGGGRLTRHQPGRAVPPTDVDDTHRTEHGPPRHDAAGPKVHRPIAEQEVPQHGERRASDNDESDVLRGISLDYSAHLSPLRYDAGR